MHQRSINGCTRMISMLATSYNCVSCHGIGNVRTCTPPRHASHWPRRVQARALSACTAAAGLAGPHACRGASSPARVIWEHSHIYAGGISRSHVCARNTAAPDHELVLRSVFRRCRRSTHPPSTNAPTSTHDTRILISSERMLPVAGPGSGSAVWTNRKADR
jgi:hypothetical protein